MTMQRRLFFNAACAAAGTVAVTSLGGCGFKLREAPKFAFASIYISAPVSSPFGLELQRNLEYSGSLKVVREVNAETPADVTFDVVSELRDRIVVGINASGQVRELQLRLRTTFRLRTPGGKELIAPTEVVQQRDVSYRETIALAKEAEEALLYRNMQTDIVQQIVRRLAALKSL